MDSELYTFCTSLFLTVCISQFSKLKKKSIKRWEETSAIVTPQGLGIWLAFVQGENIQVFLIH
jgi:hypothetical protein